MEFDWGLFHYKKLKTSRRFLLNMNMGKEALLFLIGSFLVAVLGPILADLIEDLLKKNGIWP